MADNTTTYKAVIETEVTGTKEVEDLGKAVDDSGEKFVSLRRQIRETTVELQSMADKGKDNTEEFRKLSEHLKELQVQQKKVAFEAKNTTDKLAELPGPIGEIGKTFKDAKESVEIFGKSTVVALGVVGAIVAAFLAMKEALSKTKEGQEALGHVTEAFGKILDPIFALLEKVGVPLFEALAKYLEWFGKGVNWVVDKLGVSKDKIKEIGEEASKANKEFYDQAEKDLENAKKYQDFVKQQKDEARRKEEEAQKKHLEKLAEQQRLADDAEKRELTYQLQLIENLKKKVGNAEPIGLDGLTPTQREKALKEEQARKKYFAEKTAELTTSVEKKLADGTIKIATSTALTVEAEAQQHTKRQLSLEQWLNSEKAKLIMDNLQATRAALNLAGNLMDKQSDGYKAVAIAQTTIDTYQSATASYKSLAGIPVVGPALGFAAAAAAVIAGILNVKNIVSTPVPQVSSEGGGGGSASAAVSIPTPTIPTMQFNDSSMGVASGNNPTAQIADTLANTTKKPVQAYVVSTSMSSQQALDRRTNLSATF